MKKMVSLLFICFCVNNTLFSQVIFQDNFESYPAGAFNNNLAYNSATGFGWWQVQNSVTSKVYFPQSGCPSITPDQHKVVNTGAYQGANCARVFYNTNELWSGNANATGCRWRAEFAERLGDNGLATSGPVEVWYGFMVKPMKTNGQQWTKRCMGTTGNDVSCVGLRDNLVTHVSQFIADETGATAIEVDIHHDLLDQANPRYFDITNIGRTENVIWDNWNSIVMHVKTGSGGVVEAWVNGVFYTSNSINLWTATWTHDFKIGIYGDRVDQQAEAFFDNVKFAKGTNQFAAVNPVISTDTQAPSTPANLAAGSITATSVNLTWNASTDNVAVTAYNIYQNNAFIKSVSSSSTLMSGLSPNTSYDFYVKATDAAGNISGASNTVNITTPATPSNLLPNGDVENGLTGWSANNATIAVTTSPVHGGAKALKISSRNQNWSCGQYDITDILNTYGPGNYAASIWAKMASGSMNGYFQIKITANGISDQKLFQASALNSNWSKLSGTLNLTWAGTVTSAYIFVDGDKKTTYYLDDAIFKTGTTARNAFANEQGLAKSLLVYPNPAHNNVHVVFPQNWIEKKVNIELYNQLGQKLMEKKMMNIAETYSLEFPDRLNQGTYILRIENFTDKVIQFKKIQIFNP